MTFDSYIKEGGRAFQWITRKDLQRRMRNNLQRRAMRNLGMDNKKNLQRRIRIGIVVKEEVRPWG